MNERKLLRADEVEAIYGIDSVTLANWRYRERGPKYHKLEGKVFYRVSELDEWIEKGSEGSGRSTG